MPRGSVITGLITDGAGQPLPGLQVRAQTYRILPPAGERQLADVPGTNVVTDDRGIYRIFGLPAGDYAVSVRPTPGIEAFTAGLRTVTGAEVRQALADARQSRDRRLPGLPVGRPAGPAGPASLSSESAGRVAFAPVFYPGTASPSQARLRDSGSRRGTHGDRFRSRLRARGPHLRGGGRRGGWSGAFLRATGARFARHRYRPRRFPRHHHRCQWRVRLRQRPAGPLCARGARQLGRIDAAPLRCGHQPLGLDRAHCRWPGHPQRHPHARHGSHARRPSRLPGTKTAAAAD